MASADLKAELECPICLEIYKDPVMLICGHNFCRVCIGYALYTQDGSRKYSCPECREEFENRAALQKNIKLHNIVENYLSAQGDQKQPGVFCTYCVDSPVAAVKSCLLCEASLCDKHLKVHSKSPEHALCDPTKKQENRKCSIHKETFKYYCTEDSTCICVSCCLIGDHRGHQMVSLGKASEKKKEKLKDVLQKTISERGKMEEKVQSFRKHMKKVQEQADGETQRATAQFVEMRRHLEDLEKKVLRDISGQKERISSSLSDQIKLLEIKKYELSRKMSHIEELCNMEDPLTVLQESDTSDLCATEDGGNEDRDDGSVLDLDVFQISHTFHAGLSDIITLINEGIHIPEPADILLDVSTAKINLQISGDRKIASWSDKENHPQTPERFQDSTQVMSVQSFSSGRHYWDVDVSRVRRWRIGVCYPSIDRRGELSWIGSNNKSWVMGVRAVLVIFKKRYSVIHDRKKTPLCGGLSTGRVRIFLDYEAGQISFYNLTNPIQHLHTFTTTFTEPLHAVFWLNNGLISICKS